MGNKEFMLCEFVGEDELFSLDRNMWKAQLKIDGERIKAVVTDRVELINRRGKDKKNNYLEVAEELIKFPNCVLDGEMITFDDNFNKLQKRALTQDIMKQKLLRTIIPVKYVIFDVLELNGEDLRGLKYSDRLNVLKSLNLNELGFVEEIKTFEIDECYKIAKENNKEGVVVKNINSVYECKRSHYWKKYKFFKEETIKVTIYTTNPKGITAEDDKGNRVAVLGEQSKEVKILIDRNGYCNVNIQYLTQSDDTGKYRFISFRGIKH